MTGRLLVLVLAAAALQRGAASGIAADAALSAWLGGMAGSALLLLGAWVAVGVLTVRLVRLPGTVGVAARLVLRVALPRALRVAVLAAVGAQALTAPALAADRTPAVTRPVTSASAVAAVAEAPSPAPAAGSPSRAHVTVVPGDTLWSIAAQHLAGPAPDRSVAAAWPRWYAANRSVIGPDPDLLAVGLVLEAPATLGGRQ
jgi:nucleoid-associated protein YgaU